MELTENMLSETVQKLSKEMIENWENNDTGAEHQFSEEFEEKIRKLMEGK